MPKTTWMECRTCQWATGFLERGSLKSTCLPCWVIRELTQKMTWAMLVPRKGNGVPWDRKESGEVH